MMQGAVRNEDLFVVVYPYKVTEFICAHMELDEFMRHCDVQVLDMSMFLDPEFSQGVAAGRAQRQDVDVVTTLAAFIRHVRAWRQRAALGRVCVLNELSHGSWREFICTVVMAIFLRKEGITVLELYNGGIPLDYPDAGITNAAGKKPGMWRKITTLLNEVSTPREFVKRIAYTFFRWLAFLIPPLTTHRLVAGYDWLNLARRRQRPGEKATIVRGHCADYSRYLLGRLKAPMDAALPGKKAVLLDGAGPMFSSDSVQMGRKVYLTSDAWYPSLTRFFDRLETETGVSIEIAGHYKSVHPPLAPCFGNRPVHYGKTRELVQASEFVLTRFSSAISYAVIWRKPVIFICSDQLMKDRLAMKDIQGIASILGNKPVNIDAGPQDLKALLKVDELRYRDYERKCLTSSDSQRPNVQIILEDVMRIDTGSSFKPKTDIHQEMK